MIIYFPSGGEVSDTNSEQSEASWKIVIDEPMPEVSLTSKKVRESEEGNKEQDHTEKKKRKITKVTQMSLKAVLNIYGQ